MTEKRDVKYVESLKRSWNKPTEKAGLSYLETVEVISECLQTACRLAKSIGWPIQEFLAAPVIADAKTLDTLMNNSGSGSAGGGSGSSPEISSTSPNSGG